MIECGKIGRTRRIALALLLNLDLSSSKGFQDYFIMALVETTLSAEASVERRDIVPGWGWAHQDSCHKYLPHHHYHCPLGHGWELSGSYPKYFSRLVMRTERK